MITGDNAFTAVKVAREIQMNSNSTSKIERFIIGDLNQDGSDGIIWRDYDTDAQIPEEDIAGCVSTALAHMQAVCNDSCPPPLNFALCITGPALSLLENPLLCAGLAPALADLNVVPAISIFARVSPAQKAQIVSDIEEFGAVVGMCGDGGNDVSALRQATFGFALSEFAQGLVIYFLRMRGATQHRMQCCSVLFHSIGMYERCGDRCTVFYW
jgi:magnesium-transporting ATPase (P-type)